jgi:hypothetical protein
MPTRSTVSGRFAKGHWWGVGANHCVIVRIRRRREPAPHAALVDKPIPLYPCGARRGRWTNSYPTPTCAPSAAGRPDRRDRASCSQRRARRGDGLAPASGGNTVSSPGDQGRSRRGCSPCQRRVTAPHTVRRKVVTPAWSSCRGVWALEGAVIDEDARMPAAPKSRECV